MGETRLTIYWPDYLAIAVTCSLSIGIGIYHAFAGSKHRTTQEYLMGSRQMKVLPVAISLMVSSESSIMMLGNPAEAYQYGLQFIMSVVGGCLSFLFCRKVFVPVIHGLHVTTINQYYAGRFKKEQYIKYINIITNLIALMSYTGVVIFGTATAMKTATGFSEFFLMIIITACALVYTSIGGYKAVIWTDVMQTVIVFGGIFAILIKGTIDSGGFSEMIHMANEGGRLKLFDFRTSPYQRQTFWSLIIGTSLRFLYLGVSQTTIQRINSTPTVTDAKRVVLLMIPMYVAVTSLSIFQGVVAYSYYHKKGCDPIKSGELDNPNQIMPYMVLDMFSQYPGVAGLYLSSILSASLSTISSTLSSMSAIICEDITRPLAGRITDYKARLIAQLSVVVTGAMCTGMAVIFSQVGGTLIQITVVLLSGIGAPMIGVFVVGILCPWIHGKSAVFAAICAAALCYFYSIGRITVERTSNPGDMPLPPAPMDMCPGRVDVVVSNMTTLAFTTMENTLYNLTTESTIVVARSGLNSFLSISMYWLSPMGIVCCVVMAHVFTLCFKRVRSEDSDPRYSMVLSDAFCSCLPARLVDRLRCGYQLNPSVRAITEKQKLKHRNGIELEQPGSERPDYTAVTLATHNDADADALPTNS